MKKKGWLDAETKVFSSYLHVLGYPEGWHHGLQFDPVILNKW
jgi:hypothetical protein